FGDSTHGCLWDTAVWNRLPGFLNLPDVCVCAGLVGLQVTVGLEVLVGKNPIIEVLNGTDVLLPCTFTSCMGHKNAIFWWTYQLNKTMKGEKVRELKLRSIDIEQEDRIKFVGDIDKNNISLLLDQVDFEDSGLYTCSFKNPNERNQIVNATIKLIIVIAKVDNTLTFMILAGIGAFLGLIIVILIIKKLVVFLIKRVGKK
uniref:Ig-like domain-containing protein n=1 Tax=Callorhinchus milii TaxID=7868 RepID=A0A4W3HA57_CALMI